MPLRLRILLLTALGMVATVVVIVGGTAAVLLRSGAGQEWVRSRIEQEARALLTADASVELHGLRFYPIGSLTLDSLVLRDSAGRALVQTGRVAVAFEFGPLIDAELLLRHVDVRGLRVEATQDATGHWDLEEVLAASGGGPSATGASRTWRVHLDSVALTDAQIALTRPDSLPSLPALRQTFRGLVIHLGESNFVPARGTASLALRHLAVEGDDPPVDLQSASGALELAGDTVRVELTRWALPGSRGSLRGSVILGVPGRDLRVVLNLRAERFAFADIAWLSDLLPATGGGRATVRITSGRQRGWMRYAVSDLAAESNYSRFTGRFVADVGDDPNAMELHSLVAELSPLDLRLVRELFGDSTPPPPLDGALRGRIYAAGGALTDWQLDSALLTYEDRRIGGARSRFRVGGRLDLLASQTVLKPLQVRIDSLDVRTLGAVVDVADSLRGFVTGRVRLEGPVDDLLFGDLRLEHHDGPLPVSRVSGSGRFAEDTSRTWLEARLDLERISVAAFGRAFTEEALAGVVAGTLNASVRGDSVALDLALDGEGAEFAFVGATSLDTARLVAKGTLRFTGVDMRRFLPEYGLPGHYLTGRATLGLDSPWEEPAGPMEIALADGSEIGGFAVRDAMASLVFEPGGVRVDTLAMTGPVGTARARGRLSRDPALRDTLRFALAIADVAELRGLLPDSLAAAWLDSLSGRVRLDGIALGSFDTLDLRATLTIDSAAAGSHAVRTLSADLFLDGFPKATRGLATLRAQDLVVSGIPIARLEGEVTVREATWADASLRLVAGDTLRASLRADIHWMGDSLAVRLDSLDAVTREAHWSLVRPATLFSGPDRRTVKGLDLRSLDGARVTLDATVLSDGTLHLTTDIARVPLAHARFAGLVLPRVGALASLNATLTGTSATPQLSFRAALDSVRVDGIEAPSVNAEGSYTDRKALVDLRATYRGRPAFTLLGELPLDLTLNTRAIQERLIEEPLYVRFVADGAPLSGLATLLPSVRDLGGGFDADVQVAGTWRNLEPRGLVIARDVAFSVPALGTGFREGLLDLSFAPDSIMLHRARLSDERSINDSISVDGAVVRNGTGWRADVRTIASRLRIIDDPRVAEADVSWTLQLRGPLDSLALSGDVSVPNANIFIGRQQRRILALEEEVTDEEVLRYAPRIEALTVRLGNEVRLRSPEANVQLTGSVDVTGALNAPDVRGEILATRGTYRLDLGLLQRTFQVDSGRVRMHGPLSVPATLDIHTVYTVRQAERDDVRIGARLTGTVDQPRLTLSSGDLGTTTSETEIISYLLFGAPSFVLDGESASAVRLATAALVPSLGGAAERALGARIPFLSELQVTTVAGDSPRDFTLNSFEGLLNSFALTAGTQLGTDSYLRVSGGVCRGENRAAQSLPAWMGVTAEYRPRERLSAELSLTPGGAPCNRVGTWTQIYQFGMDLFRDFRW